VHAVRLEADVSVITENRLEGSAGLVFDRRRWGVRHDGATSLLRNGLVDNEVQLEVELAARRDLLPSTTSAAPRQREPVIASPCEGCEGVFEGLPDPVPHVGCIAPSGEPGQPMRIEGVVRDAAGAPAEGVIVYAYQTDAAGVYPEMSDPPGSWATRHGGLRAWSRTDAEGRYRFETISQATTPAATRPSTSTCTSSSPAAARTGSTTSSSPTTRGSRPPCGRKQSAGAEEAVWSRRCGMGRGCGGCGGMFGWGRGR
jgi:hypothetical protein